MKLLRSEIDGSLNHPYPDGSEFRLVERDDHDTIYLSSHTGCALGCGMCWLTTSGQTVMEPLTQDDIVKRAARMHERRSGKTRPVNFAFMARGDALMNGSINGECVRRLLNLADGYAKVSISTIFPTTANPYVLMQNRFGAFQPTLYWSVYSVEPEARKVLVPNGANPADIVCGLRRWQRETGLEVIVHHALVAGVNDDVGHTLGIAALLAEYNLRYRVNLVRFNPPPGGWMREASDAKYEQHAKVYAMLGKACEVRPRVGPDVFASCGQFTGAGAP